MRGRTQSFPKEAHLRSPREYERVREAGRKVSRGAVLVGWIRCGEGPAKLGIVASKKVGGAVARNQAKRWIREWFRKARETMPRGLQLVVIVRPGALEAGHAALEGDLAVVAAALARGP